MLGLEYEKNPDFISFKNKLKYMSTSQEGTVDQWQFLNRCSHLWKVTSFFINVHTKTEISQS